MINHFTVPFPHLVIDNFLDKKQCENIINELKKKMKK
jgi:mannitol-specific phosphotransferase system IIBC component